MPNTLRDNDWNRILRRIQKGECTPFLGAGASYEVLPLGGEIARAWATEYKFPIVHEANDLIKVSQFLAVTEDAATPRDSIIDLILNKIRPGNVPNFDDSAEPHRVLADLPLPIYITTNYDDFMIRALRSRGKEPVLEVCRWKRSLKDFPSIFDDDPGHEPTIEKPIVFHLHGYYKEEDSLVVTEDDYLDFIVNLSENPLLMPARIRKALRSTSILFLGYKIADWNFRVLFRGLLRDRGGASERKHVSVQLVPGEREDSDAQKALIQAYLDKYYEKLEVHVYWGTCREFAETLGKRWRDYVK